MREPTKAEKWWTEAIEGLKAEAADSRVAWERLASMYRADEFREPSSVEDEDDTRADNNYFFPFAETMVASLVPPHPAITVSANRSEDDDTAKVRSLLINKIFERDGFGATLSRLATRASVWPRCFLKAVWRKEKRRPVFRVVSPAFVWFDMAAEDWEDVRWLIEITPLTRAQVRKRTKGRSPIYRRDAMDDVKFSKYPDWIQPDNLDNDTYVADPEVDATRERYQWATVFEVYDFVEHKFYHFADGVTRALLVSDLPYEHVRNPFRMLAFNDNLRDLGGLSDAQLTKGNIERLQELTRLQLWHIKTAIPVPVVHEGLLDDPESFMDAYEQIDGPGQVLSLPARQNARINDVLGATPVTQLPVEWERAMARLEKWIEFVLALPAYSRGAVGQSDVATELALTDTAQRTRNSKRQEQVYAAVAWAGRVIIDLYRELLPEGVSLPIRVRGEDETIEATRETLGLDRDGDDWLFEFEAHPFNAQAKNEVAQLKKLVEMLPVLLQGVQAGHVDMRRLLKTILEYLYATDLLVTKDERNELGAAMQRKQAEAGVPASDNQQMPAPAAGGLDGSQIAPEARAALMGGVVNTGTGAQAVDAGLGGGAQPGGGTLPLGS